MRRLSPRLSTWRWPKIALSVLLAVQAAAWVILLGSRFSFHPAVPQYLFGIRVTHEFAMSVGYLTLAVIPMTGVVTVVWLCVAGARHWRERRRQKAGHCPACGYDLRATSERCPECGVTPADRSIVR